MEFFNVVTKQVITNKSGEDKVRWHNVGKLVQFEGGEFALNLHMYPDTKFYVFKDEPKQDRDSINNTASPEDVSGIPF